MLRHETHGTPETVTAEFQNIDRTKQDNIVLADRDPISTDKGNFWVNYTTPALFVRNQKTGAWGAV